MNKKLLRKGFISMYILYLVIAILALREFVILRRGTSIHSWVGDPELFYELYNQPYSWNEHLTRSENVIQFLARLFYLPFVLVSKLLGISMFRMLPWIYVFLFSLSGFSAFLLVFYLIKNGKDKIAVYASAFLAGLYYMSYPFFAIGELTEIFIIVGFSFFPLVVLTFIKGINEYSYSSLIASVFVATFSAFWDTRYLFNSFIVYFSYTLFYITLNKFKTVYIKCLFKLWVALLTVFILFGGLNFFYFSVRATSSVQIPLNKESYLVLWEESTPLNLLRGFSWPQLSQQIDWKNAPISRTIHTLISLVPPLISLSILLWKKEGKRKFDESYYFALVLSLILVLFSSQKFVEWLVIEAPYNDLIGRMFRAPRIPTQLIAVSITSLLGSSLYNIASLMENSSSPYNATNFMKSKRQIVRTVHYTFIFVLMFSTIIITSFPFFTHGTINTFLTPVRPSNYYREVNSFVESIESGRVFWFPPYIPPNWYNAVSGKMFFYIYNSKVPTIWPANNRWVHFIDFLFLSRHSLLRNGEMRELALLMAASGFSHIIVSNETNYPYGELSKILTYLNESDDFELVYSNKHYFVFEVRKPFSEFEPRSLVLIGGGLKTASRFINTNFFNTNYIIAFLDDEINGSFLNIPKIIVLTNCKNNMDILIHFIDDKYIYPLTRYNKEGAKYLTDPHHGLWHSYIEQFSKHKWEYSYILNYGFFTFEKTEKVEIPLKIDKASYYILFARVLKSTKGGELEIHLSDFLSKVKTFDETKTEAEFVWVKIGEIYLHKGSYILEIRNIRGNNVINILALIPEDVLKKAENEMSNVIRNKRVIYIVDLDADAYHSSSGDVIFPLSVIKDGKHRIAIKTDQSYDIIIDGKVLHPEKVNVSSPWLYSESTELKEGGYNVVIKGVYRNLVVNPSFEDDFSFWSKSKEGFFISLDDSTCVEGEFSLKVTTNTTEQCKWSWIYQDINVTSGEAYVFSTNMKWENVRQSHIAIDAYDGKGWFRLISLPSGRDGSSNGWVHFEAKKIIPDNVTKIRISLNGGWVYDQSKGNATTWFDDIRIYKESKLDKVFIFSVKNNETLQEFFKVERKTAKIIEYTMVNPTFWKIKVNTTGPFMLAFAESYDPLWEAKIYNNGKLIGKVKPVPLYGVINGFWVNTAGDLEIHVRYTPQNQFKLGLAISGITFVVCLFYLIYDRESLKLISRLYRQKRELRK